MYLRSFAFALGLGASFATAQDTPKLLKLHYTGVSLRTVLEDLSKQTGTHFQAGQLGDRPIIAHTEKMSAKAFLDTLARLLDAEWTKSGEIFTLERGPSRLRIAEDREAEARVPWVAESVTRELKSSLTANDWTDAAIDKRLREDAQKREELLKNTNVQSGARVEMIDSSAVTPATMILHEALRKIPAKTFASVLPNQRLVLATSPTRMQKALPYVPATLDDYLRAHNRLVNATKSSAAPAADGVTISTNLNRNAVIIDRVAKLIVIVSRFDEGLQVSALVVGPRGEILDRPQVWLAPSAPVPGVAPQDAKGDIQLNEESKAILQVLTPPQPVPAGGQMSFSVSVGGGRLSGSLGDLTPSPILSPRVRAILADPVKQDPQGTFVAETFIQLANARGKDLIAVVPDYALAGLAQRLASGKMTVPDLYKYGPVIGLKIEESDSILVSTSNQARADRSRVNRSELAKLVAPFEKRGYATLDELCRYTLVMPTWTSRNLDALWLKAIAPAAHAEYSANRNIYLKLYATLTPSQRQASQQRSRIPAVQMSAQQKGFLEEIVFKPTGPMMIGNGQMMMVTMGNAPGQAPPGEQESSIVQAEPTEAFPNGLPPNTLVTLLRETADGVFAIDDQGRGRFLSAGDLGLRMGINPANLPPGTQVQSNFTKYYLADLTSIDLSLQFGRRTSGTQDLMDPSVRTTTAVAYDQLPARFKDQVDRARQRAMNMNTRTQAIGGGGSRIPPN